MGRTAFRQIFLWDVENRSECLFEFSIVSALNVMSLVFGFFYMFYFVMFCLCACAHEARIVRRFPYSIRIKRDCVSAEFLLHAHVHRQALVPSRCRPDFWALVAFAMKRGRKWMPKSRAQKLEARFTEFKRWLSSAGCALQQRVPSLQSGDAIEKNGLGGSAMYVDVRQPLLYIA